jgi:hypothetical protein
METPEHDKLAKVADKAAHIAEFLEWLGGQRYVLAGVVDAEDPEHVVLSELVYDAKELVNDFLGIDTDDLEDEKLALLEEERRLTWAAAQPPMLEQLDPQDAEDSD